MKDMFKSKIDMATDWLVGITRKNELTLSSEIYDEGYRLGFNRAMLLRAKKRLGIGSFKRGIGVGSMWYWGMKNKTNIEVESIKQPCVYFIRCLGSDYIKIGITSNLSERLKSLQVSNPHELVVDNVIKTDNPEQEEAELHEKYKQFRIRGEWFWLPQEKLKEFHKS